MFFFLLSFVRNTMQTSIMLECRRMSTMKGGLILLEIECNVLARRFRSHRNHSRFVATLLLNFKAKSYRDNEFEGSSDRFSATWTLSVKLSITVISLHSFRQFIAYFQPKFDCFLCYHNHFRIVFIISCRHRHNACVETVVFGEKSGVTAIHRVTQ